MLESAYLKSSYQISFYQRQVVCLFYFCNSSVMLLIMLNMVLTVMCYVVNTGLRQIYNVVISRKMFSVEQRFLCNSITISSLHPSVASKSYQSASLPLLPVHRTFSPTEIWSSSDTASHFNLCILRSMWMTLLFTT